MTYLTTITVDLDADDETIDADVKRTVENERHIRDDAIDALHRLGEPNAAVLVRALHDAGWDLRPRYDLQER